MNDPSDTDLSPSALAAAMRRMDQAGETQDPNAPYAPPGGVLDWLSSLLPDWLSGRSAVMQKRKQLSDIDRMLEEANR